MARLATFAVLAFLLPAAGAAPAEIPLPAPRKSGPVSVEAALASRRSVRSYSAQGLTLAEVGQLLWAAQGITGPEGRRTAPSAHRRYPLEIAVVAQKVEGLPSGAYRYLPAKHALELLTAGKEGTPLLSSATSQAQVSAAPAVFAVAAVYERMEPGPRNRSFCDYEAGLASENLLLQAVGLGLGAVVTGGIDPVAAQQALRLPAGEQVLVIVPVGHPGG